MRVSDRSIYQAARASTARAREAAQEAQDLVARGTRFEHPGDDPVGAGMAVAFELSRGRFAAIESATAAAADELSAADTALDGVGTSLTRARELAMQLAGDVYSPSQRAMGATEVSALLAQVISELNTRFGNRYLFGGDADGSRPFDEGGTYRGDAAVRKVEVAPGVLQQANVRADLLVAVTPSGAGLVGTLRELRDALEADDGNRIRATLAGLDDALDRVATARAEAGANLNAIESATAAARLASDSDRIRAGAIRDVDLTEAAIQLQATQTALQASLAAAAQSFRISLLDFLR